MNGGSHGRARRGEQPMVPEAEFRSYYGLPILNAPVWHSPDIPGYFFLGGLAGGSSVLAAVAGLAGETTLARRLRVVAAAAAGGSAAALAHDLGRPSRFYNMLRAFKPTSPMSVGAWLLAAYGPSAGVAALAGTTQRWSRLGRAAGISSAVLGPLVATYTAALVTDTAVPAWHEARRTMPFAFAGSSLAAAGGAGLLLAGSAGGVRRVAVGGAALEAVASELLVRGDPLAAEPYGMGRAGAYRSAAKVLTVAGAVLAVAARRRRLTDRSAGVALLAGSVCSRLAVFHAGMQSAADPRYVVQPQRERRSRASAVDLAP